MPTVKVANLVEVNSGVDKNKNVPMYVPASNNNKPFLYFIKLSCFDISWPVKHFGLFSFYKNGAETGVS
jgi:hypothetical protein